MEYLSFMVFLTTVLLVNLAPADIVFSGFSSPAFWLTFAGIPIGLAIQKTGIALRISEHLVKIFTGSYLVMLSGMALFGILIAFIMPSSSGRVILILPVLIAFARANGYDTGSKGYMGILIAGIFASNIAGFTILPSNLPNIILMGTASSLYHINLSYSRYFMLNFPILGLVKIILMLIVVRFMFNEKPSDINKKISTRSNTFTLPEIRLSLYITVLLIAWLSESITHLSPAWPALVIATICLMPKIGLLDHRNFMKEANMELSFYVGGLVGLSAVINYTGLGAVLGEKLINAFPYTAHHSFLNYYLLVILSTLVGLLTTLPGIPAFITPIANHLAQVTHLPLTAILTIQTVSYSMFILPYQSPPMMAAIAIGKLPFKTILKMCLIITALSFILIMPLDYLWLMLLHAI